MKSIATIVGLAAALVVSSQAFADDVKLGSATGSVSQSASLGMGHVAVVDIVAGVAAAGIIAAIVAGASDDKGAALTTSPTTPICTADCGGGTTTTSTSTSTN